MITQYIIRNEDGSVQVVETYEQYLNIVQEKMPQTLPALAQFQDTTNGWIAEVDGVMQ